MLSTANGGTAVGATPGVLFCMAWSLVRSAGLICTTLSCVLIAGCGSGEANKGAGADRAHLAFVADSYGLFLKEHRRIPQNVAEFREFVTKLAADDPRVKGQTVDELLTSERDGKPFGLVTAESSPSASSAQAAYEQVGVDGRRLVADTAGNIQEVDEATFRELVPDAP